MPTGAGAGADAGGGTEVYAVPVPGCDGPWDIGTGTPVTRGYGSAALASCWCCCWCSECCVYHPGTPGEAGRGSAAARCMASASACASTCTVRAARVAVSPAVGKLGAPTGLGAPWCEYEAGAYPVALCPGGAMGCGRSTWRGSGAALWSQTGEGPGPGARPVLEYTSRRSAGAWGYGWCNEAPDAADCIERPVDGVEGAEEVGWDRDWEPDAGCWPGQDRGGVCVPRPVAVPYPRRSSPCLPASEWSLVWVPSSTQWSYTWLPWLRESVSLPRLPPSPTSPVRSRMAAIFASRAADSDRYDCSAASPAASSRAPPPPPLPPLVPKATWERGGSGIGPPVRWVEGPRPGVAHSDGDSPACTGADM